MPDAPAAPETPAETAQSLFEQGMTARRGGDRAGAAARFRQALALDAAHQAARVELATTLRELGRLDEAEAEYQTLHADQPGWFFPLLGLGLCARARGDIATALTRLRDAVAVTPAPERSSRLEYATLLREQGRTAEAEEVYAALLAEHPDWFFALLGLGLCARQKRDLAAAERHLVAAVAADGTHRTARFELATTLRELNRLEAAEAQYRAALDITPAWPPALLGLALCARLRRDWSEAAQRYAACVAASPQDEELRREHAAMLHEVGRVEDAESAYRAMLDEDPQSLTAVLGLGQAARQRRDLPAALAHFAMATALAPHDRSAQLEYATTLRELHRPDEAAAVYRRLLDETPGQFHALFGLGLCARQKRDLAAAAAHLAAAVAAGPRERAARHDYATTLRELERVEQAEAEYRAVLELEPTYAPAMLGLGLCARARRDRAAALRHFEAAVAARPDQPQAWLEILTEHSDAGRFAEARAIASRMLARDPTLAQGWLGLGRLERQAGDRAAALAAFRDGHRHCPEQTHFLIEMAIEAQALGEMEQAAAWLAQAAGDEAHAPLALTLQGEQARIAQRLDEAVALFRRAAALSGAPAQAFLSLAQTLGELGRPEEAFAALDEADRRLGARPDLAARRAHLLRRTGRLAEALALARAARDAAPAHFGLWQECFDAELLSDGPDSAGLDALLAAAPATDLRERARLAGAHGVLAERRWRLEEAAAQYRQALALDPGQVAAHEALARVSLLLCDVESARASLRGAMAQLAPARRAQGLSLHLAHLPQGQILDEFAMDAGALRQVAEAGALAPAERVAALLDLARQRPGHTPTSLALLIALRQTGQLAVARPDAAASAGRPGPVPPRIAQFWAQPEPPADVAALMASWPVANPDHGYVRFDFVAAQDWLRRTCVPDVLLAFRRAREPARQAELLRLAWLFREGGVWADADSRGVGALAETLPPGASLVLCQDEYGALASDFIAAAPLHPALGLALRLAVEAVNRGDDDLPWLATGPGLLSRAVAQTMADSPLLATQWLAQTAILERHQLTRAVARGCMVGYRIDRRMRIRAARAAAAA